MKSSQICDEIFHYSLATQTSTEKSADSRVHAKDTNKPSSNELVENRLVKKIDEEIEEMAAEVMMEIDEEIVAMAGEVKDEVST